MRRPGWQTLDASPEHKPDILALLPPFPSEIAVWDEIEWIHGITSLYPWDVPDVLRQIHASMRPGGRLALEQTNAEIVVRAVMNGSPLYWLFGDPQHRNPLYMNHWAYTPASLTSLLLAAGFKEAKELPAQHHRPDRDFRLEVIA